MKKVFIFLWTVVGLFCLGIALVLFSAFTTHATDFAGLGELHLKFETEDHKPLKLSLSDVGHRPLATDAEGAVMLQPKFESRETNLFDSISGGPHPRTSIVSFFEDQTKRHELTFTYDKHGHVWQAEVAFPDPTIAAVEVEKSTLDFKGLEGLRRRYESVISAKALVGPPIIKND